MHVPIPAGPRIRRIWPSDFAAFRDHLLRLDPESRHDRFAMAVSDEFLERYARSCFRFDDRIYGWFVDGVLRGAGEFRRIEPADARPGGRAGEAAFSIEKGWRRRGAGAALMSRILRAARNRGVDTLYMSCLAGNHAMQALARKFSARLRFEPDDVAGRIAGEGPTPFSVLAEAFDDVSAFATAMFDLQARAFPHGPG